MTECNHLHERTDQYDKTFPITDGLTLEDVDAEITKQLSNKYVTQTQLNTKLLDYYSSSGGALTGNLIERNTDSDHLGICGAYWGHGAYLWLSGQNSGYGGSWYLSARDGERSCDLVGSPSGVLSWGGKLVATEDTLLAYAKNSDVMHLTGTESVDGYKSFLKRIAVTPSDVGTTGYTIIIPFTRGDTTIQNTNHATFRVQDKDGVIVSEVCTENHTDGNVLQSFNIRNTTDSGDQVSSTLIHSFNKDASNDTFYANRPSVVSLGNSDHKWSDVQTEKINGDTVVTPTYLETYLENKAEEWEFTLADGLSITKKVVCA